MWIIVWNYRYYMSLVKVIGYYERYVRVFTGLDCYMSCTIEILQNPQGTETKNAALG